MYSAWSVAQLKAALKARGGSLKGRKADLVSRLESFDRNLNFGIPQCTHETDDVVMEIPAPESYRDINASTKLPPITKQHIKCYFNEHDKKPDDGQKLYEARFLTVIRAATVNENTYIKGITRAAMKRLHYEFNIKLHSESGTIEETSCECVAGSGANAHCKHVATVLYGVEHMVREKNIIKYQAPTEKLQKFHVPRNVFTSSPIVTYKLPMKRPIANTVFSPCLMKVDLAEYNKRFRSLVLNHPSNMPIKQLYEPANPYGVELDHCYSKENGEAILLDRFNLNSISAEKAALIESETCGQIDNENWKNHRLFRITASKFHVICHLRATNHGNYANQILSPRQFSSGATNHGLVNEKVALQQFMEDTGLQVVQCGLFISTEHPYLGASPDGILGEETIIEIKCPYSCRYKEITPVTVPYIIPGDREGEYKLKKGTPYYYQVQGQMYCSGRLYCNLIIFTFKELKVVFVQRDDEFIDYMLGVLKKFHEIHFKKALFNKYLYKNYIETIKPKV